MMFAIQIENGTA